MQGGPSRHRESKDKARRTIMSYLQCQYIKSTEPLTSNEDEATGQEWTWGLMTIGGSGLTPRPIPIWKDCPCRAHIVVHELKESQSIKGRH